jgi:hypothetical protein
MVEMIMTSRHVSSKVGHILVMTTVLVLLTPIMGSVMDLYPMGIAKADPPLVGDWIISSSEALSDQEVVLTGNLTVATGGSLVLDNVTIEMNCTFNGQFNVTVRAGGSLVMRNSTITPIEFLQMCRYNFQIRFGSSAEIYDSTIEAAGTGNLTMPSTYGLYIETSNAKVVNNTFTRRNIAYLASGIVIGPMASPLIEGNEVSGMYPTGITQLAGSNSIIRDNRVTASAIGITSVGANPTLISNNLFSNIVGIQLISADAHMEDNFISGSSWAGVASDFSTITMKDDNFVDNRADMLLNTTGLLATGIQTTGGTYGLDIDNCTGNEVRITNSSLLTDGATTISINASDVWLVNCQFDEDELHLTSDQAKVHVAWYLDVQSKYGSGTNASNVAILIKDLENTTVHQVVTDGNGWVRDLELESYNVQGELRTNLTPHQVSAIKDAYKGKVEVEMDSTKEVVVTLDDLGPQITILEPVEGLLTNRSEVEFIGNATDNDAIKLVEYKLQGQAWQLAHGIDPWNFTMSLPEGDHQVTVRAVDEGDNIGTAIVNLTVDTMAPILSITTPKDGALVNTSQIRVEGRSEADAEVVLTRPGRDDIVVDVGPTGNFSFYVNLSEGENIMNFTASDLAGNKKTLQVVVELDTTPPSLTITSPEEDLLTNKSYVEISGTTDGNGGSTVTINGLPMDLDANGTFSQVFQLADGSYTFKVVARDDAGNSVMAVRNVKVDTTPPGLEVTVPEDNFLTNSPFVSIVGSAESQNVTIGELEAEPYAGTQDGWWDFDELYPLEEGTNEIVIMANDQAGNRVAKTITVILDTVPPELSVTEPVDGTNTKDAQLTIVGTTEPGATVRINGSVIPDTDGSFSVPHSLVMGKNTITISSTDGAGNSNIITLNIRREKQSEPGTTNLGSGVLGLLLLLILLMVVAVFLLTYHVAMAKTSKEEKEEAKKEEEEEEEEAQLSMDDVSDEDLPAMPERGSLVLGYGHDEESDSFTPRPRDDYVITRTYDTYEEPEISKYSEEETKDPRAEEDTRSKKAIKKKKGKKKRKKSPSE